MKQIIFVMTLAFVNHANADLYKQMTCRSSLKVATKGKRKIQSFKSGHEFKVSKEHSQIMQLKDKKGKPLLKVYPWDGVHFKVNPNVQILAQNTYSNKNFSFEFNDQNNKKIQSISCTKY